MFIETEDLGAVSNPIPYKENLGMCKSEGKDAIIRMHASIYCSLLLTVDDYLLQVLAAVIPQQ